MFTILQIIISVVVIYLIFSVIVYVIVEWISGILQMRGKMLRDTVFNLFRDERIGKMVYRHPNVEVHKPKNKRLASYIPAKNISSALIDSVSSLVSDDAVHRMEKGYETYVEGVRSLPNGEIKTLLATLGQQARNVKELGASIEKWYDDSMDRLTGLYKKRMRLVILIVSAAVTLSFNVDTIYIILATKADPVLRQHLNDLADKVIADSVVNRAVLEQEADLDYYEEYVNDSSVSTTDSLLDATNSDVPENLLKKQNDKLDQLLYLNQLVRDSELPIGWGIRKDTGWLYTILGWIITTFALSAGAPFWFDMLKKLVNIRSAGPNPNEKK